MKLSNHNLLLTGITFLGYTLSSSLLASNIAKESSKKAKNAQPNVILFALDDLNDMINPLGYSQVKTPNFDRLAKSGMSFTNAHAPGAFSAPSRTAIMTGLHVTKSGCYEEDVFMYDHPDYVTLQMAFKNGGYQTFGAGKIYHHRSGFLDQRGWDEYHSRSQQEKDMAWEMNGYHMSDVPLPTPYPNSPYYTKTGRTGGSALHLEWGPIDNNKENEMVDFIRTKWACEVIRRKHDKPFFLALGLYCPHYPNYAPKKYFDLYNRDSIQLPPYKEGDLDDLPAQIRIMAQNKMKQHKELEALDAVKDAILGYLACVSFADAMLGKVLDELDASPYKNNTIVVAFSDQGFHLGEKGIWGKHTLWQRTSHVPFLWSGPGIPKNTRVSTTVSLIDMYPTFVELCKLPNKTVLDGVSLASTLKNPKSAKDRNVILPYPKRGGYAVINMKWRYIQYDDKTEEFYNRIDDPNDWTNLAGNPQYRSIMDEMKKSGPTSFAPPVTPKKDLDLIVEGDKFRWVKKDKNKPKQKKNFFE
jgi:arylsulfatase A-like enzyme